MSGLGKPRLIVLDENLGLASRDGHGDLQDDPATDAYWLVCCFPKVVVCREDSDFELRKVLIDLIHLYYK